MAGRKSPSRFAPSSPSRGTPLLPLPPTWWFPRFPSWSGSVLLAAAVAVLAGLARPASDEPAGAPGAATRLAPGVAVERRLTAGGADDYAAALSGGKPYGIQVEQRGIDVVLEVRGPDGSTTAVDGPLERWGTAVVLLRPPTPGLFHVEVRSPKRGVGAGHYQLRLDELAESTPAERERIAALAAATEAGSALYRGAASAGARALAAWERAREHFHAAGEPRGEAESANAAAALSRQEGQRRRAQELYRDAATRWRQLGQPAREARAWGDLGLTLLESGDPAAADDALARGIALAGALGDSYGEADLGNDRCMVLHARGEIAAALGCYGQALELFRRLGEPRDEASVLNNLGYAHYDLGDPQPAEDSYRQALALRRQAGDRAGEAQALNNLAVLYRSLGEIGEALALYGEARDLLAALHDRRQEASALHNLGVAYQSLGQSERAQVYLTRALELRRAVEDRRGEIATLESLGLLARGRGEPVAAAAFYRQALELARSMAARREEGLARSYLGEAHTAAGRIDEALAELDQALAVQRQVGDRYGAAVTRLRQGGALTAAGRAAAALVAFGEALDFFQAAGDHLHEAIAATARARMLRHAGKLEEAGRDAAVAVAAVESLRSRLGSPELRAAFLGSQREAYEVQVEVLMGLDAVHPGQGFERRALEASERGRARSLLDVLRESGSGLPGVTCRDCRAEWAAEPAPTAVAALAGRRRDLERRLALRTDRRQGLLGRVEGAEARALELEIERLMADLDTLDAELGKRQPRWADLAHPEIPGAAAIQELLDADTLLLEYALGRERSFLWVVGAASLEVVALPGREAIESAARAFYEAVSSPPDPGDERRRRRRQERGAALARMILGPVAGGLGNRRLAIVADGALHYVPFDLLPEVKAARRAGEAATDREPRPLLLRHEIVELPSAAVLAATRRERGQGGGAPRLAIVLADPVFESQDPRVAAAEAPAAAREAGRPAAKPGRGAPRDRTASVMHLGRLAFSRQEALSIAALASPGEVSTELDFDASRALALSGRLRDYRYVHFATHGVFDAARPELSALVLSRFDRAGQPQEGSIRLRDLYGLDLAADLVVLSGCQTALGREIRGEGLLGLTRGFLYAGAARVLASRWWIDDRATAELMGKLYRGLWLQHLRPAAALRQARLAVAAERRYHDPFFWGGLVLQGDWR
jgi:CHAT domain-containing protein/tetratricopeptide (TPR) repeat protein